MRFASILMNADLFVLFSTLCYVPFLMRTSWSRGHATRMQRHQIPKMPSKSGLIGVWHKDNLYLNTNTIGNGNPHPTNIDSQMRSIRMTSWRQLFFDKLFFSSLENHGREIISPTHRHKVRQTKSFINLNGLTYMSGDDFIYIDSKLKQTLMDTLCGLIWCPLTIKPK